MNSRKEKPVLDNHIPTVLLCAMSIPLSMSIWIGDGLYSKFFDEIDSFYEPTVISSGRWLASFLIPGSMSVYGYRKKSVNITGAIFGFLVGCILTLSNYGFFLCLFTFFMTGSKATKFRPDLKRKIEADFKEGGQRGWVQVLCNSGMAAQLAILYLLDVGANEMPVDFVKHYKASWLTLGVVGVFASCTGDTWASELGTVLSDGDPFLVTSLKRVPRGTNGGMSTIGTLASMMGGLAIGLSQYLCIYSFSDKAAWTQAPPQWPLIVFGAFAGVVGSFIDSFLGASLQYSGMDSNGRIVCHSSLAVQHISGRNTLDNHCVNLIATVAMGLMLPTISKHLWTLF